MKTAVALLVALALGLTVVAQTPAAKKGAPKAGTEKAEDKKEEPEIEGIEIPRGGDRGFMGIQIVNSAFKLTFYDKDKKPTPPDVARAALRWNPKYKVGEERVVLNPGEPNTLSSPQNIRPPYLFKLFITLIKDGGGADASPVSENYVIDFRQ